MSYLAIMGEKTDENQSNIPANRITKFVS